ncbi:MAG: Quaternary ammonium compound-resistance protein SugE [Candidatus Jettenia ecosi]|uniref:Guanidinium exporter n=1 Tax=Candidatus Jettenia ecosi TaxID=2494326 RepID=A0A533QEK6_9BACT|nr:MAG: Quaternary ammonium compound-resistance protein SugE [Candidatus Jettenia ecosi]
MAWIYLLTAGFFEIGWAIGLKYTEGFTRFWPSVWTVFAMIVSFFFLSKSVTIIPIGVAYSVWTGIGAVGTVILGIVLFGEPSDPFRFVFIGLIIAGIIGLKFS